MIRSIVIGQTEPFKQAGSFKQAKPCRPGIDRKAESTIGKQSLRLVEARWKKYTPGCVAF
ncbi:hypothetical protein HMPREF9069_01192 [Atopobium sp. oral taxon 810 str. F0209]|nr:hypothetical protein HMPREF9069_01192 [Atopobium sp. oral taxon 810 str. F0209]